MSLSVEGGCKVSKHPVVQYHNNPFSLFRPKPTTMDPALLRERRAFLERAKATPSVEKRKIVTDDRNDKKKKQKMRAPAPKPMSE